MTAPRGENALSIGILCEYGTLNGGERSLLSILDQFVGAEVRVVPFCPPDSPLSDEFTRREMPSCELPDFSDREQAAMSLNRDIDRQGLSLLHANSLSMGRKLGRISHNLNTPTTAHLRDIINVSPPGIAALSGHSRLLAVSEATRQFHIAQGLPAERVVTVHNGIDLTVWQPAERTGWLHRELGLPSSARLIATIGQICLRKGQQDFAAAFPGLLGKFPNLHWLLIGERYSTKPESIEYDRGLETQLSSSEAEHFHRLGLRSDVQRILPELDLLAHPARQEPFGRVLIEAAACGVPIVATDVGGTREMLPDGTALLLPPGNPDVLAEAVTRFLEDDSLRQMTGRSGRAHAEQNLSVGTAARRTLEIWQQCAWTG